MALHFANLIKLAQQYTAIQTAVVHPVTVEALSGAIEAARQQIIEPIFVGPKSKINQAAKSLAISLDTYQTIDTEHSHAAAETAVKLARAGNVQMLMKGSLHTEELMLACLHKENGLRTDRRMSHVFALDIPQYQKLLLLTDGAINITPTLMEKRDIVQNAIDLALAIGIEKPKVALLSAVETVNEKLPSTIDAAALCKMADRKQIIGAIIDGPLGYDNAISEKAAQIKGIKSSVAGDADVLVVPNMEAGNMLAKQLEYLTQSNLTGLVLGARIPIVLTSRADNAESRLVSCRLGLIYNSYLQTRRCSKQYL